MYLPNINLTKKSKTDEQTKFNTLKGKLFKHKSLFLNFF